MFREIEGIHNQIIRLQRRQQVFGQVFTLKGQAFHQLLMNTEREFNEIFSRYQASSPFVRLGIYSEYDLFSTPPDKVRRQFAVSERERDIPSTHSFIDKRIIGESKSFSRFLKNLYHFNLMNMKRERFQIDKEELSFSLKLYHYTIDLSTVSKQYDTYDETHFIGTYPVYFDFLNERANYYESEIDFLSKSDIDRLWEIKNMLDAIEDFDI